MTPGICFQKGGVAGQGHTTLKFWGGVLNTRQNANTLFTPNGTLIIFEKAQFVGFRNEPSS